MGRNYVRRANPTKYMGVIAVERRICCFWMVPKEPSSFSLYLFLEISSLLLRFPFQQLPRSPSLCVLWSFNLGPVVVLNVQNWQDYLSLFSKKIRLLVSLLKGKGNWVLSGRDPFSQTEQRASKTTAQDMPCQLRAMQRLYGCSRAVWQP